MSKHHLRRWKNDDGKQHFVLSNDKTKVHLRNPIFTLTGGTEAQCFVLLYRQSHLAHGGPVKFWVNIDGRDISVPLENGNELLIGVTPGRHKIKLVVNKTGPVNLNRSLETGDLQPGEMHFYEVAIGGKLLPKTKLWDHGRMKCPLARIPEKKVEERKTTTTITQVIQQQPLPPQMIYGPPMPLYGAPPQSMMMGPPPQGYPGPIYGAPPMGYMPPPQTGYVPLPMNGGMPPHMMMQGGQPPYPQFSGQGQPPPPMGRGMPPLQMMQGGGGGQPQFSGQGQPPPQFTMQGGGQQFSGQGGAGGGGQPMGK